MSSDLPTIWALLDDASRALPEPFSRAAPINWGSARRPERSGRGGLTTGAGAGGRAVGAPSTAKDTRPPTATAGPAPPPARLPLLSRVAGGLYRRYRPGFEDAPPVDETGRVVLIGSSG